MTCCPRSFSTNGAMARASVSSPPPAGDVTISFIGFLGKSAPNTGAAPKAAAATAAQSFSVFNMALLLSFLALHQGLPGRPRQIRNGQQDKDFADDRKMQYGLGTAENQAAPAQSVNSWASENSGAMNSSPGNSVPTPRSRATSMARLHTAANCTPMPQLLLCQVICFIPMRPGNLPMHRSESSLTCSQVR